MIQAEREIDNFAFSAMKVEGESTFPMCAHIGLI